MVYEKIVYCCEFCDKEYFGEELAVECERRCKEELRKNEIAHAEHN